MRARTIFPDPVDESSSFRLVLIAKSVLRLAGFYSASDASSSGFDVQCDSIGKNLEWLSRENNFK